MNNLAIRRVEFSTPMKTRLLLLVLAVLGHAAARAGSAVATDHHGGFGYAYGSRPVRELRREAVARCREQSRHPDEVEIVASTSLHGVGVVMRYRVEGRQHIYAYVGAGSFEEARRRAEEGARERGADDPDVVARWED